MFKVRLWLLMLCLVVSTPRLSAQSIADKIHFVDFVEATHISTSGMNLWVEVQNDSGHRIIIPEGEVEVLFGTTSVMTISLRERVVIPRRGTHKVLLPLRFNSRSSMLPIRILRSVAQGEQTNLNVNYRVRAGVWFAKRNFVGEGLSMDDMYALFAVEESHLKTLLKLL